ncbi:hypothetical protein RHMOL_Rhmol09G0005400 [Rhododendron molle]|uniref:Uncharacterized protein n=1 Tax=Rhododendron molle TaxID=49168 RepID=A0ACC0M9G1_RHOML|nr:hypothetical protein RHMOL_Rhmol09G0005400 [Rhododendron molle]
MRSPIHRWNSTHWILINLCELQVQYIGEGDIRYTIDSIGGLRSLQTLKIEISTEDTTRIPEIHLHPLSRCQHLLQLKLLCRFRNNANWKLPTEVLPNLKYLFLDAYNLTEDPMPMLEKLPKLTVLLLYNYPEKKLVCTSGGFPQLEILQLVQSHVDELQMEVGGMPVLMGLLMSDDDDHYYDDDVSMPDRLRSIPAPDSPFNRSEWAY